MRRGLLFFRFDGGVVLGVFLLFLFGAGLSGCGGVAQSSSEKPVVCTPQAQVSNVNIYRTTPVPVAWTNISVQNGGVATLPSDLTPEQVLSMMDTSQQQGLLAASPDLYIAFGMLVNETKSWSTIQTIKLDGSNEAQIVVTFLSPLLIQAVYYTDVLSQSPVISSPQAALDEVAARDELIFFVSVITTTNNNLNTTAHMIDIPVREMVITNSDDLRASPLRDDHILDQPINSTFEPVFGYLTYPIAMLNGVDCSWILDPDLNKKIIITVPSISVDGVGSGPYTWTIPYSSLFKTGLALASPAIAGFDTSQISKSPIPPIPMKGLLTSRGLEESPFWQAYSRFLWYQIMRGNY